MDINRNQYFMAGVVLLLFGIQFRVVEKFVLNEPATRIIHQQRLSLTGESPTASPLSGLTPKVVEPPEWSGWCLMSIGAVLILHSLALQRPG